MAGVKEIADKAKTDSLAMEVAIEFGQNLGEFLGPWLKLFNADCLVIGGNISGAYSLFGPYFEIALKDQNVNLAVSISELKEEASLIGSTRLMNPDFWQNVEPLLSKM